ncbi:Subtilisin-like protease [Hordeum vulgare]|nr:Subtilisin-like protease [Hordeum vulgare]
MDDPTPNSSDPAIVQAAKAKKKKAPKGTKKPRSELMLEEAARVDAESVKRRNRRAEAKRKDAAARHAIEHDAFEDARQKADAQKEAIVSKAHALLMLGVIAPSTPRPSIVIDLNVTPGSCSGGRPLVEMQRKQARLPSTATMPSPRVLFGEMPTPTPAVEDTFYSQFMENVIFEGRGEAFKMDGQGGTFDPEET